MSAVVRVGVSGWTYPPWRGVFYPAGLPHRAELGYLAGRLSTVEVNGSFYSLQRPSSYQGWREQTPEGFVLAVKGGRFVTHMKKLRDVRVPLANFLASGVLALGDKLGPLLWQLPPMLGYDAGRLADFCALLPPTTAAAARLAAEHDGRLGDRVWTTTDADRPLRHALEVRHASFGRHADELADLLRRYGVALVVADTAGKWPLLKYVTADFAYVRLHGDVELYTSGYTDDALDRWAAEVAGWQSGTATPDGVGRDVFVYFDNDVKVRAPFDAMALAERLGVGAAAG